MVEDNCFEVLDRSEWLQLVQDKIVDREQLLNLPPQEAQSILNKVINPALWKPNFNHGIGFNSMSLIDDESED